MTPFPAHLPVTKATGFLRYYSEVRDNVISFLIPNIDMLHVIAFLVLRQV